MSIEEIMLAQYLERVHLFVLYKGHHIGPVPSSPLTHTLEMDV